MTTFPDLSSAAGTLRVVCAVVVAAISAQGASARADDVQEPFLRDCSLPSAPHVLWRARSGYSAGSLAVRGKYVLVGTNNRVDGPDCGVMACFRASDGAHLWSAHHDRLPDRVNDVSSTPIGSTAFMTDRHAYYMSNRGELVCVELESVGAPPATAPAFVWKVDLAESLGVFKRDAPDGGNLLPSPVVYGDLVFCVTAHGRRSFDRPSDPRAPSFIAVNRHSGDLVWSSNDPGDAIVLGQWSSPAIATVNGHTHVIFPGGDGCLYGFTPSGQRVWTIDCNALAEGGPEPTSKGFFFPRLMISGTMLYVGIHQGECRLDARSFPVFGFELVAENEGVDVRLRWKLGGGEFHGTLGSIARSGHLVFVLDERGYLFALDGATGAIVWKRDLVAVPGWFGSPVVSGGTVFVPTEDAVVAFSADVEGRFLGKYWFGTMVRAAPVVEDGIMYVLTDEGVTAVQLDNKSASEAER